MRPSAVTARPPAASGPRLDVDLAAVGDNTRLIAARATGSLMAVVKADGFGHGALDVARTALAHGATSLGVTSLAEAWPLRDAGLDRSAAELAQPCRRRLRRGRPRATSTSPSRGSSTWRPSPQHPGRARDPPAPRRRHGPRRCLPASWPRLCRAARRAEQRGEVEVVGLMGHLGCSDDPADACNDLGRSRFAWAARDRPRLRAAPGAAPPRGDRGHPDRPAHPSHDEPGRRRPGRHRPEPDDPPPLRDDADRAAGVRTAGAGRHVRRLRPRPIGSRRAPTSGWCRSGTPTGCRVPPRRAEVQHRGRRLPVVGPDLAWTSGRRPRAGRWRAGRDRHACSVPVTRASRPWPTGRRGPARWSTRSSPASAAGSLAGRSPCRG